MRDLIYFVTCGFWTNRQVWNELPLNSSNSRGLHKRQSSFVRLSFYYPCYFRDKVINCEVLCSHELCFQVSWWRRVSPNTGNWVCVFFSFFPPSYCFSIFSPSNAHTHTNKEGAKTRGKAERRQRAVRFTRFLDYRLMFDSGRSFSLKNDLILPPY